MNFILDIFRDALMITSFVMVIMLILEYVNVKSKGNWSNFLKRSWILQLLFAGFLGATPGCLGSYAVVSLYTHNILNFSALLTAMIATFGDEALIIFSQNPETALKLTILLLSIGLAAGAIIKFTPLGKMLSKPIRDFHFQIHHDHAECHIHSKSSLINNFKKISFQRAILLFGLLVFMFGLISDHMNHNHSYFSSTGIMPKQENCAEHNHEKIVLKDNHEQEHICEDHNQTANNQENKEAIHKHEGIDWIKITSIVGILIALFIICIVPDHFLEEHLWGHIIKKHFLKILLWSLGALIVIHLLLDNINILEWVKNNHFIILIIALLIGIIPESGPHIFFFSLYISGAVPFSILLANSIVQDGHGALPLLAESKKSFLILKLVKLI